MAILSLDLGTNTGWALSINDEEECGVPAHIISGVVRFPNGRFEGGGMRYLRFTQWLDEIIKPHSSILHSSIKTIYFEEVRRHLGVDAAHAYGGFLSTLTAWCELNKIPYLGIPVGTIKKHITGKGNASKQEMIDAIKKIGHLPQDDNEADAIAILYTSKNYLKN